MPQRIFNIKKIVKNVNSVFSVDLPQRSTQIKPRLSKCLRGVYIFAFCATVCFWFCLNGHFSSMIAEFLKDLPRKNFQGVDEFIGDVSFEFHRMLQYSVMWQTVFIREGNHDVSCEPLLLHRR